MEAPSELRCIQGFPFLEDPEARSTRSRATPRSRRPPGIDADALHLRRGDERSPPRRGLGPGALLPAADRGAHRHRAAGATPSSSARQGSRDQRRRARSLTQRARLQRRHQLGARAQAEARRSLAAPVADPDHDGLNGNGVTGFAGNRGRDCPAGARLPDRPLARGGHPANAPNWNYFHTKVYYDPAQGGHEGGPRTRAPSCSARPTSVARLPVTLQTLTNQPLLALTGWPWARRSRARSAPGRGRSHAEGRRRRTYVTNPDATREAR